MRRLSRLAVTRSAVSLLAVSLALPASAHAARGPAHAKYDLALAWHGKTATLAGSEHISFENTRSTTLHSVWLRLWPNGSVSCAHPRLTLKITTGGTAGEQRTACTAQQVKLAHGLASGKRGAIGLSFSVKVPSGTASLGRTSTGTVLLGNALPILAVTDSQGTHLEPYSNLGEAGYSIASTWRVNLDLRRGLKAASTGVETGATEPTPSLRRLRFEASHTRDFELAIGPFHEQKTAASDGTRIRLHDTLPAGSATTALRAKALAAARDAVDSYDRRFGPYGAHELDIVQTDSIDGEGMEYPQIVFVQMTPASASDSEWPSTRGLIAHEIAHQWFYGIVGNDQWSEPFLDESFATFASGFPGHGCTAGDPLAGYPTDVRLTSTMGFFDAHPDDYYYGGLYGGGACALRDLRAGLGASRFDELLRDWVASHRYGNGTVAAFVKAIRAHAPPGFDVDAYLKASRIDVR